MFKNKLLILLILAILLAFAGCTKKDDASATTTTAPIIEDSTVRINEEQTIDATLVGTWEEIFVRDATYEGVTITETYHYIFSENGQCEILLVKSEVNVTKEEYLNIVTKWIEDNWDDSTLKYNLNKNGVSTIAEYAEKEYSENTVENKVVTTGYWSVENDLLLTWTAGGLKQFADSTEYRIENDVLYVGEDGFTRVK